MVQIDLGDLVVAFVAAMGVPSAIMGLIVWALKKRVDAREKDQDEKNQAQQRLMVLLVQSTRASIALGEATAHASGSYEIPSGQRRRRMEPGGPRVGCVRWAVRWKRDLY